MTDKIVVEDLYKIFGPDPEEARRLLADGCDKDEIFKRTGNTIGIQAASFTIRQGEIFVVMGLSGSGKSTLVRTLNRLIEPTSGKVYVDGRDVTAMNKAELITLRRREMGMVFQSFALMPHKTAVENAAFGLEVAGIDQTQRIERAMEALEQVGLKANANSYPDELSGGMQQRVGLARALASDPSILLMDEAFSALDPLIRTEMQDELVALQKHSQRTIVFISHDLDEAIRIGDRIAIMQGGVVVQVGTPEEIVRQPANDYVRSFFHGADVSQVFSAGDIADKGLLTVIEYPKASANAALESLYASGGEFGVVTGEDRRYLGVVTTDSLAWPCTGTTGEQTYNQAFITDVEAIPTRLGLHEVIGKVAESRCPVPVIDECGRYVGSISKTKVLQTLSTGRTNHGA